MLQLTYKLLGFLSRDCGLFSSVPISVASAEQVLQTGFLAELSSQSPLCPIRRWLKTASSEARLSNCSKKIQFQLFHIYHFAIYMFYLSLLNNNWTYLGKLSLFEIINKIVTVLNSENFEFVFLYRSNLNYYIAIRLRHSFPDQKYLSNLSIKI